MMDSAIPTKNLALRLHQAELHQSPLPPLSETYPTLTSEQAYAIQTAWLDLKQAEGHDLVGHKIGLTSQAMQQQLGVDQPDYGFLLNTMMVQSGSTISSETLIQPRLEPEIAFWLSKDLRGPGITREQVLHATRGVALALELIDSRIADWRIKLVDTIADNASSARVIVSDRLIPPAALDLTICTLLLKRNDKIVGSGTGAAVLGHPAEAVAWLANMLATFNVPLRAGQFILPGAVCAAVPAEPGDTFQAISPELGRISIAFR
jgi:2-keto-4-pentenoate hydratase